MDFILENDFSLIATVLLAITLVGYLSFRLLFSFLFEPGTFATPSKTFMQPVKRKDKDEKPGIEVAPIESFEMEAHHRND